MLPSPHLVTLRAGLAALAFELAAIRLQLLLRKANFNPGQLRDETGRWTTEGDGDGLVHDVARRRGGRREGTSAQEARHDLAAARAREATRRLRELEPTWQGPESVSRTIEGEIAHQLATARAAEARLAEILRDAVPNTNPSWSVNRLRRELSSQGYMLSGPATRRGSRGIVLENSQTREQVRIMERPTREPFRTESRQKFHNRYYYRYKPANGSWGSHITIPGR